MKKIITLLIVLIFTLTGVQAAEHTDISVYVDNEKISFDTEPYLKGGYTMVPMRAIMEALGASVSWEEESRTATAVQNVNITKFTIGSHDYYRNGALQYMPMAAEQVNDRTYVPLRAISEGFGYQVNWDDNTSTVYIISQKKSVPEENIYYIQGKDGGYLTLTEDGITVSPDASGDAMWALECVDSEKKLFRIYSLSDLYNPLGWCDNCAAEEIAEETDEKTGTEEISEENNEGKSDGDTGKKDDKAKADEVTTETVSDVALDQAVTGTLGICTARSHQWVIEPTENGYRISPLGADVNLDADKADVSDKAELMLIPCL